MSTIGQNFQRVLDAQNYQKTMQGGGKGAQTVANQGLTNVSKQATKNQQATESLDKATLDRLDRLAQAEAEEQAKTQGQADVADNAAQSNKMRKKEETGKTAEDLDVGPGEAQTKTATGTFVDEADEAISIPKEQAKALESMDDKRHAERILEDMPEANRTAASSMLSTQLQTKGSDKVAELKDDPKVGAVVEEMDLEPAESLQEAARPAPIMSAKNEKPMLLEDPHSENLAKEAAAQQLREGGAQEQMIA